MVALAFAALPRTIDGAVSYAVVLIMFVLVLRVACMMLTEYTIGIFGLLLTTDSFAFAFPLPLVVAGALTTAAVALFDVAHPALAIYLTS